VVEREARVLGSELHIYPSTYVTATVGGYVAGGSAGIGSITWGNQWDGNVLVVSAVTMEDPPRRLELRGDDLHSVIHAFGTTAVITDVTIPLAPATAWAQCVVAFPDFDRALAYAREVAEDDSVRKRLVSVHEWPIPSHFGHLKRANAIAAGHAHLLLEVDARDAARVVAAARDGVLTWQLPGDAYHVKGPSVSDFSFNHTTLWAKRADPELTYLQVGFDRETVRSQVAQIKARLGDEFLIHIEYLRSRGTIVPSGLPIVRFRDRARIEEIVAFLESMGATIRHPYSCRLDATRNRYIDPILAAKRAWDPKGLLNPGKLAAEPVREGGGAA
jgi:FAD/FMN-containing dehydrogenase